MPVALTWRPIQSVFGLVSPHGLGAALGFLLGAKLLLDECRRRDLDPDVVVRALTWAAVGAILGSRLDYVLTHTSEFFGSDRSLVDVLKVWEGGLAMFGGFIGGVALGLPLLLRQRVHAARFLDAAAPGFAVGILLGRIGDLIIWDHLGDVATGWAKPIGLTIKKGYELAPGFEPSPARDLVAETGKSCSRLASEHLFSAGCTYHQPALYDFVGVLILLAVLLVMRKRAKARAGVAICLWGAWYGVQRLVVDRTRSIDENIGGLSSTQILGIVLAAVSITLLVRIAVRRRGLGELPGDPPSRLGPLVKRPVNGDVDGVAEESEPVPADQSEDSSADSADSSTPSA
jgi:phosphatidylglycerol:prolipoprotein diacylglycerol transferase